MEQCGRCGAELSQEELDGNFQEHDCSAVLAERREEMLDSYD